jgi:hypothetical protein
MHFHRRNPLKLTDQSNSIPRAHTARTTAPVSSSSAATQSRRRPDAAPLSTPAKHTTSTTSPRGSFLATSPPSSGTPAIGTPSPPLRATPPASVHRRLAASTPLFLNSGHTRDRRDLVNLFPHFSLAAGEPRHRNLIAVDRLLCLTRPRTQLQGFKSFQDPFCEKSVPPFQISQL